MRCYRKVLRISYKDHVTNEEVHAKIQRAFGLHEDLLTIVKRSKLQWYGHVSRSSGLAKTILQGIVKGEEDKADKGRGGKTTSANGQSWSSPSPKGQCRTGCEIICGVQTTLEAKGIDGDNNDDDDAAVLENHLTKLTAFGIIQRTHTALQTT